MDKFNIKYDLDPSSIVYTVITIAYGGKFAGYLTIADSIKTDSKETVEKLHQLNVKATMLSGDKNTVVQFVAKELGIDWNKLSHDEKIFLKGDMIDQYAGTGVIDVMRWTNLPESKKLKK